MTDFEITEMRLDSFELKKVEPRKTRIKISVRSKGLINQLDQAPQFFCKDKDSARFKYFTCDFNMIDARVLVSLCDMFKGTSLLPKVLSKLEEKRQLNK